jgi:pimeloyl-ACP methyl ester carboxylesterase
VVLGGHSMGGMALMAFAGRYPDVVRAQVVGAALVSTTAGGLAARVSRVEDAVMHVAALVPGARTKGFVTTTAHRKLVFGDDPDPADVDESLRALGATRLTTVGAYHAALSRHDERESLAVLQQVPTHVVVGERDQLTPVAHAYELVTLLPHAELDVLPGLGHMLVYEAPDRVAAHLIALLDTEEHV